MAMLVALTGPFLAGGANGQPLAANPDATCIGAGESDGRYAEFVARLVEELGPDAFCAVTTAGSVENLAGLRDSRFPLALVQSDLAHHQYFGDDGFDQWREFSALAPLFPEYVQVFVRAETGAPALLGDLRGGRVNVGVPGSGGALNARDVMRAAGLQDGVDYRASQLGLNDAFPALLDGEVDAVIVTAARGIDVDPGLRALPLPPGLVADLAARNPYYEASSLALADTTVPALAVRAYLLARNDTPPDRINAVMDGLLADWDGLSATFDGLIAPDSFLVRTPLPVHPRARAALVEAGHANPAPAYWMWITVWAGLLTVSFIAVTFQTTYDRTGHRREREGRFGWLQTTLDWWAKPSPWVIGLSLFALTLLIALLALRSAEAAHARSLNQDNAFADLTLSEGFIWMLTFVASGFTENDAYPLSVLGRLLVAILAFIGVSGPIAAIVVLVNLWSRKRADSLAGLARTKWQKHVLVCGWNEHLDGVVYALTGQDAEHRRKVCIVAEAGDATPLTGHHFDPGRVSFRRGDSSDRDALEKAGARSASHAIILADYGRRSTRNIGAVLTAMNLKRLNPEIHVSAELAFSQNADHFEAFGCSTLITPDIFVAKAAALSTIHPLMIDYLLEVLTYDGFDELYTIRFDSLCAANPDIRAGMDSGEVERELWACGANLVGLVRGSLQRAAVFDAEVVDGGPIISYTRPAGYAHQPAPDDHVIYASGRRDAVRRTRRHRAVLESEPIPRDRFRFRRSQGRAILIYASQAHIQRLKDNLTAYHQDPVIHAIAVEDTPFLTKEALAHQLPDGVAFDHAIVLASAVAKRDAPDSASVRAIDAATLLATKLIRQYAEAQGWDCRITAEVLAREDREAFVGAGHPGLDGPPADGPDGAGVAADAGGLSAGATAVVPSATLVERFLVKDVFDGNAMLDFLIGVMNMRDGTHLYMHDVEPDDPLIGATYASLIRTRLPGLHLVGWLPVSMREHLRNKAGDFGFHFRTAFDARIEQHDIRAGDLLVFTACFRIWDEARGVAFDED